MKSRTSVPSAAKPATTRRNFLKKSAAAGVAACGKEDKGDHKAPAPTTPQTTTPAPAPAKDNTPITLRFQSTWPTKDIFHEFAVDFGKKVNEMSGGRLKIEVLPAGGVVKAFDLLDAVA